MENKPMSVRFAAINRTIEESIVKPTEKVNTGSMDYVIWGNGNNYPDYLDMLYDEVPTLKTCINGLVDYVCGNDIVCKFPIFNGTKLNRRQSGSEVIRSIAEDEARYGGFAFQVIRSIDGTPAEVYYMPLNYVRTNKERDVFFYSEDWGKKNVRKDRVLIYPALIQRLIGGLWTKKLVKGIFRLSFSSQIPASIHTLHLYIRLLLRHVKWNAGSMISI
jgi:hypothetical protein